VSHELLSKKRGLALVARRCGVECIGGWVKATMELIEMWETGIHFNGKRNL
jgi:hypothetical protein